MPLSSSRVLCSVLRVRSGSYQRTRLQRLADNDIPIMHVFGSARDMEFLGSLGQYTQSFFHSFRPCSVCFRSATHACSSRQVSSLESVREALVSKQDVFSGRPGFVRFQPYTHFQEGIQGGSVTPSWKLKKKAMITSIKM